MDAALKVDVQTQDDSLTITLRGAVSETAQLSLKDIGSHDFAAVPKVYVDTGGVMTISASGVRLWMAFMQELCSVQHVVAIRNLAPILCTQASTIPNFLGTARVETFYTPWCCVDCDYESLKLHRITDVIPEFLPCPDCGSEMEFDDIVESYLAFRDRSINRVI